MPRRASKPPAVRRDVISEIDVLLSPGEAGDAQLRDRQVVVIDVLRSTTVIAYALAHRAEQIIPAGSVEDALALKGQLDRESALLCGERDGRRISGFDLGNSPSEYDSATVAGRSIVLASTNGTVLLARCALAQRTLVAAFVNLSAGAAAMRQSGGSWTIVCSGKLGRACLEDIVCAGRLARAALGDAGEGAAAHDGVRLAMALERLHGDNLLALLRSCSHGRFLESIGFGADLPVCAAVDALDLVPEFREGRIFRIDTPPDGLGPAAEG